MIEETTQSNTRKKVVTNAPIPQNQRTAPYSANLNFLSRSSSRNTRSTLKDLLAASLLKARFVGLALELSEALTVSVSSVTDRNMNRMDWPILVKGLKDKALKMRDGTYSSSPLNPTHFQQLNNPVGSYFLFTSNN